MQRDFKIRFKLKPFGSRKRIPWKIFGLFSSVGDFHVRFIRRILLAHESGATLTNQQGEHPDRREAALWTPTSISILFIYKGIWEDDFAVGKRQFP